MTAVVGRAVTTSMNVTIFCMVMAPDRLLVPRGVSDAVSPLSNRPLPPRRVADAAVLPRLIGLYCVANGYPRSGVWTKSQASLDRSQIQGADHAATCGMRGRLGGDGGPGAVGHGPSRLRHVPDEQGRRDHGHRHGPRLRQSAFLAASRRHTT